MKYIDRILYYNGPRNVDFHETPFEYEEVLADHDAVANQTTERHRSDCFYHQR